MINYFFSPFSSSSTSYPKLLDGPGIPGIFRALKNQKRSDDERIFDDDIEVMGNCGSDFSLCNVRDPDVNEDTSIQNLKNWKVRIQSSNDRGVGVFALKRIEAGEVCFGYWGDEGFPVAKWKV